MSTVLDSSATQDRSLSSLTGAAAANEDSLPTSNTRAAEANRGWDAYEVWRRLIKEARDRREGMTL